MGDVELIEVVSDSIDDLRNTEHRDEKGSVHYAQTIIGRSIKTLRNRYIKNQIDRRTQRSDYDSDSDSDDNFSDIIKHIAKENTVWCTGCGCKLTIDTTIYFVQIMMGLIIMLYCMIRLWGNKDCEIQSTYVPLLTAIIGYVFGLNNRTPKGKK